ncbi:MAG: hypothetical protein IPG04_15175 [Polyangiaceae bacterium]|nr:hypothetical protein [Polyangiaceae bacterium]
MSPSWPKNCAALPAPSAKPAAPDPATVRTMPEAEMRRMRLLPQSDT